MIPVHSYFLLICSSVVIFIISVVNCSQENCQTYNNDSVLHLGSKTPYRITANFEDKPPEYPGCKPVQILGIIRHGTRTAATSFSNKMVQLSSIRDSIFESVEISEKSTLCEEDKEKLKKWIPTNIKGEKILAHEGEDEMIELAERYRKRFPTVMVEEYSNNSYHFRYTNTQRTAESARYFTVGLFGRKISQKVAFPQALNKDPILRFYKLCKRWKKDVKESPVSKAELLKYENHQYVLDSCKRVSKVLGFDYTLGYDVIHTMYLTCCFETAWTKHKTSPWCSVFSNDDIKVFEYAQDLKLYWRDGYGFEINYIQACPVIKHVFTHFRNNKNTPAVFYFTHSGTILKLLSHFGLYKDDFVLSHDTSEDLKSSRKWQTSQIDSFGANLVFINFDCDGEAKVLTLHQERVVKIPGCPNEDLCPLSLLEKIYSKSIEECDFDQICSL